MWSIAVSANRPRGDGHPAHLSARGISMSTAFDAFNFPAANNFLSEDARITSLAKRMLADIASLAPEITSRAAQFENARRIPLDLIDELKSIGVFRMLVPRSQGGLEFDLPTALEIVAALAEIDGSVGWTAMIGGGGAIFAPLLQREAFEQIYQHGPNAILAGSVQPAGTAEQVPGGWRVKGRWPFASGCLHADWMLGVCVMTRAGKPLPGERGAPMARGFLMPAREWQIEDTWNVAGLKGTGSHHITFKEAIVPEANFFDLWNSVPCVPGPLYQALMQTLPLMHSAFAVGMGEGALRDLVQMANSGRVQQRTTVAMRDSETFQGELGRVAAKLRAARAFFEVQAANHWRDALAGTLKDEAHFIQTTQAAIWLATTSVDIASKCFALGGGSALYETSPLQRRLRDIHAAAQHAAVHERQYVNAGKLLLGDREVGHTGVAPSRR